MRHRGLVFRTDTVLTSRFISALWMSTYKTGVIDRLIQAHGKCIAIGNTKKTRVKSKALCVLEPKSYERQGREGEGKEDKVCENYGVFPPVPASQQGRNGPLFRSGVTKSRGQTLRQGKKRDSSKAVLSGRLSLKKRPPRRNGGGDLLWM